eukprot:COSAG06_NODE_16726_length_984_cov_1.819209_2_plen_99_part_00
MHAYCRYYLLPSLTISLRVCLDCGKISGKMVSEILKVEDRMKQNHEAMAREVASVKSSQEASIGQVEAKVDELGGQMTEMKALLTQLLAETYTPPATS